MSKDSDAIVEAVRLVKHFKSGGVIVPAVDDVSFKLPRGKMIAIKGSSGSGKTTLLNLIGNLDKPTQGSIVVDGVNVSETHGREEVKYRLRKVGFVFQSYYLLPQLTALENVMLPMELMGVKRNGQEVKARKLLERVGIDATRQARRPTRLSGGEQQRVAIARAMANDPPIILADEPTGNLDSKTGQRIVNLLYSLTREGRTVIVATHSAAIAARADIVLEMEDGKLTVDTVFEGVGVSSGPVEVEYDK
jgi:ABC-type lipoprotein export system ATPase subunit